MKRHSFDPTVLRAYDVRGVVGKTLHAADAEALARGVATLVRRQGGDSVAIGYDGRLSSPDLEEAVARGVRAAGAKALRIGLGPTPMLYYAVHELDAGGGIMITGSHNPPEYNGFKLMLGKKSLFGERIAELGRMAEAGDWEAGSGGEEHFDLMERYVERLLRDFDGPTDLKVAWDAGNGAAGPAMVRLTDRLPGEHILLYEEIDGSFPNHHPDPTVPENLTELRRVVLERGCDLGIAFDGDGDRIGALDGQGRVLWGDQLMLLLAREVLEERPGAPIIADVKASQVLFDGIAALGGKPIMGQTGHSLVKAKMVETGAPFAGEMSAHLFFADRFYGHDDALYAAVRLLNALKRYGNSLAHFRDALPKVVNTPELRFPCDEARKFAVIEEVAARLKQAQADVIDVDGVRVRTADGWWLLRASNTQDVLVARCEAADEAGLERLYGALAEQLRESGLEAPPLSLG